MSTFWIRNAVLVAPSGLRDADVRVEDDLVAAVVDRSDEVVGSDDHIDAEGLWLLPGGVDVHTHFGMPLRPGVSSLGWRASSTAALRGGTTTIVDFANPDRDEPIPDAVARWQAAAAPDCLCDYGLHATVSAVNEERLEELADVVGEGVPTLKGFLAYKGRLMLDADDLRRLMVRTREVGGRLLLHAEDGELNARREAELIEDGCSAPRYHPEARPAESEIAAVATALDAARDTGCPLTIVHLSTAGGLELIDRARAEGIDVTAEVCTQHLFRTDAWYGRSDDDALTAIMSPPLRPESDAAALRLALADGRLDWLATDHCQFPLDLKRSAAADGFPSVPNGAGGVGERLIAAYTCGVKTGLITPERWVDLCCRAPADAMGLGHRKGRIEPGFDADLVLFDPEATGTHLPMDDAPSLWSGDDWHGAVHHVWRRGRAAVQAGRLVPDLAAGRFLPRSF